jgi:hypothetical protein
MIPAGSRSIEVAVADVVSVEMRRMVPHPLRIAIGVAAVVLPWFFLPWWVSIPLLILGLWAILTTLGPHLELRTKAGKIHRTPVCPGHSLDADLYVAAVRDMIAA